MYCFNWSTTYWAKEHCHFESRSTKGSHWECNSPTVCRSKVHQIKVAIICWIMWYSKGSSLCSSASTSELVPKWRVPQCNKMTTVKKDIVLLKHQTKILTDVMGCSTKKNTPLVCIEYPQLKYVPQIWQLLIFRFQKYKLRYIQESNIRVASSTHLQALLHEWRHLLSWTMISQWSLDSLDGQCVCLVDML